MDTLPIKQTVTRRKPGFQPEVVTESVIGPMYKIVVGINNDELVKKVNDEMSLGWSLVGGPFLTPRHVCQAMQMRH